VEQPGQVNVYIPTPTFASHYNTTDGTTKGTVNENTPRNQQLELVLLQQKVIHSKLEAGQVQINQHIMVLGLVKMYLLHLQ